MSQTEQKSNLVKPRVVSKRQAAEPKLIFGTLGVLIGLLIIYLFLPPHLKDKNLRRVQTQSYKDNTLHQNLERLVSLQHQEKLRPLPVQQRKQIVLPMSIPQKTLTKELQLRMNAPIGFGLASLGPMGNQAPNIIAAARTIMGKDRNSQFLSTNSDITTMKAKRLPHPAATIVAGEMIPAILETAIHSDLPGMVRAITSRDVYAFSGRRVLIPKGSVLVGQYNASVIEGQSRVLVIWNRVLLSEGIIVTLNSPSTDSLGRAGQAADSIERHFFERFGSAALLSLLGAYTATAGVTPQDEYNSLSQYRDRLANSLQQTAAQELEKRGSAPSLQVHQGAVIGVFVAHDLDFSEVLPSLVGEGHGRN